MGRRDVYEMLVSFPGLKKVEEKGPGFSHSRMHLIITVFIIGRVGTNDTFKITWSTV